MQFRGRSLRNLDSKSRLMLPPEFRENLLSHDELGKMILTTYDDCIVVFPMSEWLEFEQKLNNVKNPPRMLRNFRRLVVGGAEEMVPDGQGRIRLSKDHMTYAGIEGEAVLVGQGQRFELWDPERLKNVMSEDFSDVSSSVEQGLDISF